MIQVDFNPDDIPGSLLLTENDLKGTSVLAVKLRDAKESMSEYLLEQFSPETQQLLANYQSTDQLSEELRSALVDGLNQQLQGPSLFARQRFKGIVLERDILIKALIKQPPQSDGLLRLNRLLLEDAYPAYITKSPRAEWEGWVSLARDATDNVIKQWENWKANPGNPPSEFVPLWEDYVWKGIRDWLLKYVFHNKCAYCETAEVGYISDAEHFRPKGQVRNESGIVKTFDVDGVSEITHPGYFWLAYHWQNLLPSCNTCNRYGGKKDIFPVGNAHIAVRRITDQGEIARLMNKLKRSQTANDIFYLEPEALDMIEDRLLLHPYFDDPEESIYFELDGTASVHKGSKRGKASIEVFDLNDKNKVAQRNRAQTDDTDRYITKVKAAIPNVGEMKRVAQDVKNEYYKGARPYGAAVFDTIHHWVANSPLDPDVLLEPSTKTDATKP
ncbi:MAG: hypothetical protein QOG23_2414 [Blastocatellia bacterium]|nr:hypothetical protein [Blastocatellia bacterium]